MNEFLINQTTAGNQSQPSVVGFRGTQFVAVWEDHSGETIKGRLFGVNGAPSDAEFLVNIPGKPGQLRGTVTLTERGGETVKIVDGDIKVSIPLVGGKLEGLIGDLFRSALRAESRVGARWLAD